MSARYQPDLTRTWWTPDEMNDHRELLDTLTKLGCRKVPAGPMAIYYYPDDSTLVRPPIRAPWHRRLARWLNLNLWK